MTNSAQPDSRKRHGVREGLETGVIAKGRRDRELPGSDEQAFHALALQRVRHDNRHAEEQVLQAGCNPSGCRDDAHHRFSVCTVRFREIILVTNIHLQ